MTNSEQQLEFIRLLSLDSETNFTNTKHFSFAMKKLSMLLNSPFFIFTVVYKDIQNKKSHYNSYCLNTQNNEPSEERVVVNVNQSELPDTICLLNRQLQDQH